MVIQLMRYGADPSVADGEGYRALHLAILFQHMAIAAYLIAKGQVRHITLYPTLSLCNTSVFTLSLITFASHFAQVVVLFLNFSVASRKLTGLTAMDRRH